jgi:putative oxidoreductase
LQIAPLGLIRPGTETEQEDLVTRYLGQFSPHTYALLRIVAGFMFMLHGLQKIFGVLGGKQVPMASMFGAAGIIETVCGVLVLVGLFGSIAAFIASGEMAAAYFIAHIPRSFWPIMNGGELAALYCFLFLYVAATGSGIWSVDALRAGTVNAATRPGGAR